MEWIRVFFIACALAIDCMAVSLSIGLCRKEANEREILKLALCFGIFQAGMTLTGAFGGGFLAEIIGSWDHWVAFALLGWIGIRMIREAFQKKESCFTQKLGYRTVLSLAIATSLDALAVGFSFGIIGHEIAFSSTLIGIVAFAATEIGVHLGKRAGKKISSKWAEIAGGCVLIAIGTKILVEHLHR